MTNEQAPATHRKLSGEQLNETLINSGDHEAERYSQACALTGIGYALLDVADAIREQTTAIERLVSDAD